MQQVWRLTNKLRWKPQTIDHTEEAIYILFVLSILLFVDLIITCMPLWACVLFKS